MINEAEKAKEAPAGWKLVPVEPTEAMLLAAFKQANEFLLSAESVNDHCKSDEERSAHSIRPLYRAMLAASPPPSEERK